MSTSRASETSKIAGSGDSLLRHIWHFVRPHYALLGFAFLLIPLTAAADLARPFLLGLAIDTYITHHISDGLTEVILIYFAITAAENLFRYLHMYCLFLVGQRAMHALREATYRHVLTRGRSYFDQTTVGRLLAITNDIQSMRTLFSDSTAELLTNGFRMVAIVATMLYLDARLTLLSCLTIPLVVVLVGVVRKWLRNSYRKLRAKLASMSAHVQEHLSGLTVLQLFCREETSVATYTEINQDRINTLSMVYLGETAMFAGVRAIGIVSSAIIAWYAGSSLGAGTLTIGLVVVFIEYTKRLFQPIVGFSSTYAALQSALAGAERVVAILKTEIEDAPVREVNEEDRRSGNDDAVEFRDIRFQYRDGAPVLNGINLRIKRGQKVAIVGATGSGKSTLIKLLSRRYETNSGHIFFGGQNILELEVAELRRQVTVVNQDIFLFEGSVRDNVRIGKPDASDEEVDRALEQVGATEVLRAHITDEDMYLSKRGENLSVGERQLISFARALVRDPELLILDEATAHIDPTTEEVIGSALDLLMKGRTTLVVAHRLSTIRDADQIVLLDKGMIAEQGTYGELVNQGGLFAKLESSFSRDS